MNKQVKELWEEATVSTWPHPGKFTAGEYDYHLEKFAELIVEECFRVAAQKENGDSWDYNSGRSWAGIDILKHFGVEE